MVWRGFLTSGFRWLSTCREHPPAFGCHGRTPTKCRPVVCSRRLRRGQSERFPDAVYYDGSYPIGVGMHGGLSAHELSSLCILAGNAFRSGVVASPTSIVDLVPTILSSLGLPLPSTVQGRIIDEALQDREDSGQDDVEDASVSIASSARRATVFRKLYRQRLYLRGAAVTRLERPKNGKPDANPAQLDA